MRRRTIVIAILALLAIGGWLRWGWLKWQVERLILESPQRVDALEIERVIPALEIAPGETIADVGAGTGLLTWPLARATGPSGRVYAVDVDEHSLAEITAGIESRGLSNVEVVRAAEDDPLLPAPVDLIFLCDTLHHIADRAAYLRTLRRHLRPGGRLAIIDFEPRHSPHLTAAMRYALPELEGWLEAAGFEPWRRFDFPRDQFFVIYRCPDCPEYPS